MPVIGLWMLVAAAMAADDGYGVTVVEHALVVSIGASSSTTTETWTVRVDEPEVALRGVPAPLGLEGAEAGGGRIEGGELELPAGVAEGATFTLKSKRTVRGAPASGEFRTVPELPVLRSSVTLSSSSRPLSFWCDERCVSEYGGRNGVATWGGLDETQGAELVWTTWSSWQEAGDALAKDADALVDRVWNLGRDLGGSVSGIGVPGAAERVYAEVDYDPHYTEGWDHARPAAEVARSGEGSAAERGAVLLSILRGEGYDARPAVFRPASLGGASTLAVPAPALMTRPAVAVYDEAGTVIWIDPSADLVAVPNLPTSMVGGSIAWAAGDHPLVVGATTGASGSVLVAGSLTYASDGTGQFTASITASGIAAEALRDRLGSLDEQGRSSTFQALLSVARPSLQRFSFTHSGLNDPRRDLHLTVQGFLGEPLVASGDEALVGTVPPLLAPGLAAFLSAGIVVHEELAVRGPKRLVPLVGTPPTPPFDPGARVTRAVAVDGSRVLLTTEVERPHRVATSVGDQAVARYLSEQARMGASLALEPAATRRTVGDVLGRSDLRVEDQVTDAVLWWRVGDDKRAQASLQRGLDAANGGADAVAKVLDERADPSDPRPWWALMRAATTDAGRAVAMRGLLRHGAPRDAWLGARLVVDSFDTELTIEALVEIAERQPDAQPSALSDPEGAAAWLAPEEILERAAVAVAALPQDAPSQREWHLLAARVALTRGDPAAAEVELEPLLREPEYEAIARVMLAEAGIASGITAREVLDTVAAATASSPDDPRTAMAAATAASAAGDQVAALEHAIRAARLSYDDPLRWSEVVGYALAAADLRTALVAAQQASDLEPGSVASALVLARIGTLALDDAAARLGQVRAQTGATTAWPPSMDARLSLAAEDAELAVLAYHDAEVVQDEALLARRGWARLRAGDREGASRDGSLLAYRFDSPSGVALQYLSSVGVVWSSKGMEALDVPAKVDPVAREARMEAGLLLGKGDPKGDAAALEGRRAGVVRSLAAAPDELARVTPGWTEGLDDPPLARPAGFVVNSLLGAVRGVTAYSDPVQAVAVLKLGMIGAVPPPLAQLYTAVEPAVRRLDGGGQIVELSGGQVTLYAAIRVVDGGELYGLGFTPDAAERALHLAEGR